MAQNTEIGWTRPPRPDGTLMPGHTANLWIGCVEVHDGCNNCYARVLNHRWGKENWGNRVPRRAVKKVWNDIFRFQKLAQEAGEVHYVFVGSMMDIFEKPMPVVNNNGIQILTEMQPAGLADTGHLRRYFFETVVPACPNLMFLLLTKRPSNINKYIPESWKTNPPANVMFGTSPVNQETADKLIPQLLEVKGKLFLSVEPMLGSVDLERIKGNAGSVYQVLQPIVGCGDSDRPAISWVICGGESGGHKRPFNPDWARKLRDQCKQYGVPFFMKQWDKIQAIPEDLEIKQFPLL